MSGIIASEFIGQSKGMSVDSQDASSGSTAGKGMSQKEQAEILMNFKAGTVNVLVATSIAEGHFVLLSHCTIEVRCLCMHRCFDRGTGYCRSGSDCFLRGSLVAHPSRAASRPHWEAAHGASHCSGGRWSRI